MVRHPDISVQCHPDDLPQFSGRTDCDASGDISEPENKSTQALKVTSPFYLIDIMVLLISVVNQLRNLPELYARLTFNQLICFFELVKRFTPLLETSSPRITRGHPLLPENVVQLLALQTSFSRDDVLELWQQLGPIILQSPHNTISPSSIILNAAHGLAKSAASHQLGNTQHRDVVQYAELRFSRC